MTKSFSSYVNKSFFLCSKLMQYCLPWLTFAAAIRANADSVIPIKSTLQKVTNHINVATWRKLPEWSLSFWIRKQMQGNAESATVFIKICKPLLCWVVVHWLSWYEICNFSAHYIWPFSYSKRELLLEMDTWRVTKPRVSCLTLCVFSTPPYFFFLPPLNILTLSALQWLLHPFCSCISAASRQSTLLSFYFVSTTIVLFTPNHLIF